LRLILVAFLLAVLCGVDSGCFEEMLTIRV